VTETTQPRPFDERAALRELERLADKIQSTRRQRERAEAEFNTFVKAFRHDRYKELIGQHEAELSGTPPQVTIGAPRQTVQSPVPPRIPPPLIPVGSMPTERRTVPAPRLVLMAAAAAAILLTVWMWRSSSQPPTQPQPAASNPVAEAPAPPPPAPAVNAAPPRALMIELTTLRRVWIRVSVDGQRQMEREFPEGQTIPVGADKTIAIRAGDGSAVRLSIGGKDQGLLGKAGFPANKTLTAPQSAPR
jgi:Domain of unknown function (DUF4115)